MRRDSMTSHELRDSAGNLLAVLDLIEPAKYDTVSHGMIELAADIAGRSIRVRVFPPAAQQRAAAA